MIAWVWMACGEASVESPPVEAPAPSVPTATVGHDALRPGPYVELVRGHCTGCHDAALIRQQRMSRAQWDRTITWMQETQGLWEISAAQRQQVLDYLEAVQGPAESPTETAWAHPRYEPNPFW